MSINRTTGPLVSLRRRLFTYGWLKAYVINNINKKATALSRWFLILGIQQIGSHCVL